MAMTNHERVGKAMGLLKDGLGPFVAREVGGRLKAGNSSKDTVRQFAGDPMLGQMPIRDWDAAGLLKLMWEAWNEVFRRILGRNERSLVSELRDLAQPVGAPAEPDQRRRRPGARFGAKGCSRQSRRPRRTPSAG